MTGPHRHDTQDPQQDFRAGGWRGWRLAASKEPQAIDPLDRLRCVTTEVATVLEHIATAQRAGIHPLLGDVIDLLACGVAPKDLLGALHATNYIRESVTPGMAAKTVAAVITLTAPHSDPETTTDPTVEPE